MKIYLSGPMAKIPYSNKPEFHRCAEELRLIGYEVVSPAEIEFPDGTPWEEYLKADLKEMLDCKAVVNLKGWGHSSGARLEHMVAIGVGIPCVEYSVAIKCDPLTLEALISGHHSADVYTEHVL